MSVEASKISRGEPNLINERTSFGRSSFLPLNSSYEVSGNVELVNDLLDVEFSHEFSSHQLFLKRSLDLFGAIFGLMLFSVPMLIIAIGVKLGSRGPVFYGQDRVGMDGRIFKMWKFRSMRIDAEKSTGAVWAIENDPRRTKLGGLLRKSSLDEIPQFWNVLVGEMSLVGPRPERPLFVREFSEAIPGYQFRHSVPVGITGLAQVYGWRGNTSLEKRVEFDLKYIRNWSVLLDIKILFLTVFRGFINKNAY